MLSDESDGDGLQEFEVDTVRNQSTSVGRFVIMIHDIVSHKGNANKKLQ